MFGEGRLHAVLVQAGPAGAADLARSVETAVATFDSERPVDDLAILVLRVATG